MRVQKTETHGLIGDDELVGMGLWFVTEDYRRMPDGRIHPVGRAGRFESPLEVPDLFLGFARLGVGDGPDEEAVLGWVGKHGLLRREMEENSYRRLVENGWEKVDQAPMTVQDFRSEIAQAYRALTLFEQIRGKDYEALRQRIRREVDWIERPVDEDGVQGTENRWDEWPEASISLDGKLVRRVVPGLKQSWTGEIPDFLLQAQAVERLEEIVEEKLSRVEVHFTQDAHHPRPLSTIAAGSLPFRPRLTWRCPDLESALWFQFAALMTDRRPWIACEGCGTMFLQTRPNKRVCKPKCRVMKFRKRESG